MKKYLLIILVVGVLGLFLAVMGFGHQPGATSTPPPPGIAAARTTTSSATPAPTGEVTIGPEEASCPVMGTVRKKSEMTPMQHNGRTYYVCCKECQAEFRAHPEKYLSTPAPPRGRCRTSRSLQPASSLPLQPHWAHDSEEAGRIRTGGASRARGVCDGWGPE